jgi:hypothetical protein
MQGPVLIQALLPYCIEKIVRCIPTSSYDALADTAQGVARLDNPGVISPYQEVRRKKDRGATCDSYNVRI